MTVERKRAALEKLGQLSVKGPINPIDLAHAAPAGTPEGGWRPGAKRRFSKFPPVPMSADLRRVLDLPRRPQLDLESERATNLSDMMTARWSRGERAGTCPKCHGRGGACDMCLGGGGCACAEISPKIRAGKRKCLKKLKPAQAWALYELGIVGGLIGSIPAGAGKTAVGLLAPLALSSLGVRLSLMLVPANLLEQLWRDYRLLKEHFAVPSIRVHGIEEEYDIDGAPMLHVLPYSRLSLPTSSGWIRNLAPHAIIADEMDRLKDPDGAGSSRVMRYFVEQDANGIDVRFAGWTGSLTDHSITEYGHLAALALRMSSPLPLDRNVITEWARAIDESENPGPPGALAEMCDEDLDPDNVDDLREGYRRRLSQTMGVVISTDVAVDADLVIEPRDPPAVPPIIHEALHKVRTLWVRPDTLVGDPYDEELVDAMAVAKCAIELSSGIFYRWRFDPIGGVPQRKEDIEEWLAARKDWNRELRLQLGSRKEWLDSPLLCEHAAQRFWEMRPRREDRPEWDSSTYPRWARIKTRVKPTTEAKRVSDYLAQDAAEWGRSKLGIVWYSMVEFGKWVSQLSGLPLHGGGPDAGRLIDAEIGDRSIVASIKSHGRGRDGLQALFAEQLIAQPPASATGWEQMLARLHRQGQDAPEVRAEYYDHTVEYASAFEQALRRAGYVEGTLGMQQRLLRGVRRV